MFRKQRTISKLHAKRQAVDQEPKQFFPLKLLSVYWKALVVGAILIIVVWSVYSLRGQSNFMVENVKVVATYEHLDPKALQNIIELYANANFFDIDVLGLRKELSRLPWVYSVSIRRKWPNTIWVDIKEQKAVAQWKDEALLNVDGMLFTPPKETFPVGLPFLNGPEDAVQEIVVNYRKMEATVEKLGFKIVRLGIDEQYVWHMVLDIGVSILLSGDNVLENLQSFVGAYPKIIADHSNERIESVDLRYKNGVAVKWVQSADKPDRI